MSESQHLIAVTPGPAQFPHPSRYVADLEGDHLRLPFVYDADYLIQIHEIATGRIADEFRIFKGPGEVQWHYRQSNIHGSGEWRPYFMPAGRYRAVIIY